MSVEQKSTPPAWVKYWKSAEKFVVGGLSGMASTVAIQPIDMIKVRIQLLGEGGKAAQSANPFTVARTLIAEEGFFSLYKGLSAGLLRQATYTTARMGIYGTITEEINKTYGRKPTFFENALAGVVAGGLGSIVGTPADVALIRMQADGTLPKEQRRNYTGVMNALSRIAKEEGMTGIFKGCSPVVVRAMALNMGMLAGHDETFKAVKASTGSEAYAHIAAKSVAGFLASAFSLPFDFVKTRIQKQKPDAQGVLPYKNSIDCAKKVFVQEGPMAFYKGFLTYYVRIAPHAMLTLAFMDMLKSSLANVGK